MTARLLGLLLATYFLVGRWSMDRLDGGAGVDSFLNQPRTWIIVALLPVVLLLRQVWRRSTVRLGPTSVDRATCWFLGYMLLTTLWAPNATLAQDKAIEVAMILAVAIAVGSSRAAASDEQVEDGFWWVLVLIGGTMATLAILHSAGGRIHVPGGGPNTFGRNMGLMALGAAYLATKHGIQAKPLCAVVIAVAALLILACGSRGALLSSSVGAMVLLIVARESISKKLFVTAATALLSVVVLVSTDAGRDALDTFSDRVIHQTFEKQHLSERDDLWLDAVDWIQERPWFGWGLNGYRANSWNYPHNIFLEVTVEGGIIGLLLLLNVGRAWWSLVRSRRGEVPRLALAAFGLAFTAAQTSGDLYDSRGVFLLIALATPRAVAAVRNVSARSVSGRSAAVPRPALASTTVAKPGRAVIAATGLSAGN